MMATVCRVAALGAAMAVVAAGARAEETIVSCDAFKAGWGPAWQRLEPTRPRLAFEPAGRGVDRLAAGSGVDAQVTCLDGAFSRLELRQSGVPPEPLAHAVAALLMVLDPALKPPDAAGLVDAMRAESVVRSDAVSSWGPYEIRWGRRPDGRGEVIVTFPEN